VSSLKPGLRFDKPVYIDEENLLVPENVEIKQKDIDRLVKWKITSVQTEGRPMKDLPSARKNSFLRQAFSTPAQQAAIDAYSKLAAEMQEVFERVAAKAPVSAPEVDSVIDRLFKLLQQRRREVIQLILYGLQGESGFIENAMNCAVLAILVGDNIGMVQHKLLQLATAALLHDVGMLRIPAAVRTKSGELTQEEMRLIQSHPTISYRIISKEMRFAEEIGTAALQHQERWDGNGYPRGLSGEGISLNARVISIVDAFEAMVSKRPYRKSMIGYEAMRVILSDNGRKFDPKTLKVFIHTMGIYPIGSIVVLKDGRIGRVVEVTRQSPLRPKVKIMIDAQGREYQKDEGETVDLATDKDLFIAKAVDPKDISNHL
jgi:HD-GYP domain-containing protein (c-di-GMP phosphodiesterase class II)